MSIRHTVAPNALPIPEDFPITWEDPEDAGLLWEHEADHVPHSITRLEFDITGKVSARAFTHAFHRFGMPVKEVRTRLFNTYLYRTTLPIEASPETMAAMAKHAQENLESVARRLAVLWEQECMPEIREHLAAVDQVDVAMAGMPELLTHLDDVLARFERLWEIAFYVTLPAYGAMDAFDEFYRDLFSADGAFDAYRLLGGLPNKTLKMGQALWELARRARKLPEVCRILESEVAHNAVARLERTDEGRAFLDELRAYLERYGRRSDLLAVPSWIEDPTPVLRNLRNYVTQPDDADPLLATEHAAREREEAVAHARERLAGYPQPVVQQFEDLLAAAQTATVLSEDHAFYTDFRGLYEVRHVIVEAGRRLAGVGLLASVDDVLLLSLQELREAIHSFPNVDCHAITEERRAELERFGKVQPPQMLGTPPDAGARRGSGDRLANKIMGTGGAGELAESGTLRGMAGSPGTVLGPARVIRSLDEADRLRTGDVLVTRVTNPSWTPLFATAAAVVTDIGGILSHCAVVAREYGIPAVVGTGDATSSLRDGQTVEVDGDAGLIRLDPSDS